MDRQLRTPEGSDYLNGQAVPAARPLSDFAWEQVGDDIVIFDGETMQYHTLNGVAASVWRACDGVATMEAIAASTGLPLETAETTIAELGEASLLQTSASTWTVPMNRRRAAKLIAASVAGAVGVPVVLSITAPSHQAAATILGPCALGTRCTSNDDTCDAVINGADYGLPGYWDCTLFCAFGFMVPAVLTCSPA